MTHNTPNPFALDYAYAEGRTVMQGHADYCASQGHATLTVEGVTLETCARCGDAFTPASCGACIRRSSYGIPTRCHAHSGDAWAHVTR